MGKKSKKRRLSSSSSSNSSSSSSDVEKLKKLKKKLKKERRKAEKVLKNKLTIEKKKKSKVQTDDNSETVAADIPLELMEKSKSMAPMTKEEWDKRQSVVRKVLDEDTGRYRLIKGDGEVLEEIVSRDRHKEINRQATQADGAFFQSQTVRKY